MSSERMAEHRELTLLGETVRHAVDHVEEITYRPDRWCVESKSLKLYLWGFRDRAVFVEQLAAEIADEIALSVEPHDVRVVVTQRPRGGIEVQTTAERSGS